MAFKLLQVNNFRIFDQITFEPSEHINIFSGDNGSGKTSIVEAIYSIARGRTFRSRYHKPVIKLDASSSTIFSKWVSKDENNYSIGIERQNNSTRIRINGKDINKLSVLGNLIPLQLLTPQSVHTFSSTPSVRRKLLDWGVFHVEPSFNELWKSFTKTLKQRNAALKLNDSLSCNAFNNSYAEYSNSIDRIRENYFLSLVETFSSIKSEITSISAVDIKYGRGWKREESILDSMDRKIDIDLKRGYTSVGPQYSDLMFSIDGKPINQFLSNGEQKMVSFVFKLSQIYILNEIRPSETVFLLDDIYSELSRDNRLMINAMLQNLPNQVFITTPDTYLTSSLEDISSSRMFHVKHGTLNLQ